MKSCAFFLLQYDELQKMSEKDIEELSIIREEKRTLSMTVENLKSELSQLQAKVIKSCGTVSVDCMYCRSQNLFGLCSMLVATFKLGHHHFSMYSFL